MDVDPYWYSIFHACAVHDSFSAAARSLFISQSAVSQMMGKLEQALGGPLFHRTARGVLLTAEGEALFAQVTRAIASLREGEATVRRMLALEEGQLRIGTSDAILRYFLLPALVRMDSLYPDISLTLTNTTTPGALALLENRAVDLCVVHLPVPETREERFRIAPLRSLHDCLVCGGKYRPLADQPMADGKLSGVPFVMLDSQSLTRELLDAELARRGVTLIPDFVTGSIDSLLDMAARGLGLAFVAREYAAVRIAGGELREIPMETPFPLRQIGAITRSGGPPSRAETVFRTLLREECGEAGRESNNVELC